jgi:hypothetical protein
VLASLQAEGMGQGESPSKEPYRLFVGLGILERSGKDPTRQSSNLFVSQGEVFERKRPSNGKLLFVIDLTPQFT